MLRRRVALATPLSRKACCAKGSTPCSAGDVDTGKAILRDYIKATVGFEKLGEATGTPPKSLIRMFGPARQSAGPQPLRRHRLSAESRPGIKLHVTPEAAIASKPSLILIIELTGQARAFALPMLIAIAGGRRAAL